MKALGPLLLAGAAVLALLIAEPGGPTSSGPPRGGSPPTDILSLPDSARAALEDASALTARIAELDRRERWPEARDLARRQLTLRRQWLAPDDSAVAASWSAVGRMEYQLGDYGAAGDADSLALQLRLRRFGRDHLDVAESNFQLAMDIKAVGNRRKRAEDLYLEALRVRELLLGRDHPDVALCLQNLANLDRLTLNFDRALARLDRALTIRRAACGPMSNEVASTLMAKAFIYTTQGEWAEAATLAQQALTIRRQLPHPARSDLALTLGALGGALRHLGRPAEAAPLLEESMALREGLRRDMPYGSARALYTMSIGMELAATELALGRTEEAWPVLQRVMARQLFDALGRRYGLDPDSLARTSLARVQAALPADGALIGWVEFWKWANEGYPYWGYVLRRTGPIHWIRFDDPGHHAGWSPTWRSTDSLATQMRVAGAWPLRLRETAELRALAQRLYRERFAPFEPWLEGVRSLILESGVVNHSVPLEMYCDGAGRYLSDRYTVSYTPSASFLAWQQGRPRSPRPLRDWRALLVSDPGQAGGRPGRLPPLREARQEAADIAALLPAARHVDTDAVATLRELDRDDALLRFDLLHFATHSHIDEARPERSAICLEPDKDPPEAPLTAAEIAEHWRLEAELVALSGCATYRGRDAGQEGILGLNQAFLAAGTRTLLASVWPVDDTATALLVGRFYANLAGRAGAAPLPRAAALQEARHWLRERKDQDGERPYAHPAYWAGFVLIGDPG